MASTHLVYNSVATRIQQCSREGGFIGPMKSMAQVWCAQASQVHHGGCMNQISMDLTSMTLSCMVLCILLHFWPVVTNMHQLSIQLLSSLVFCVHNSILFVSPLQPNIVMDYFQNFFETISLLLQSITVLSSWRPMHFLLPVAIVLLLGIEWEEI